MTISLRLFAVYLGLLCLFRSASSAAARKGAKDQVDFNRDIRPIFSENCYACHGPDKGKRKAGLRFDIKEEALKKLESGDFAIVPGKSAQSKLVKLITTKDEDDHMPPAKSGKHLTSEQINLLKRWIDQGAKWQDHWSYIPPERPELPAVKNKKWPHNEIDHFILARLEKEGLKPSPEADKTTLLRRASFDLTGLPPTVAEVDAFLADKDPNSYEKVVDRLLASPQYGERMAQVWLDLARYADTSGYHFDSPRYMWLWREWVIKAFNHNMPFDQFTIEQLAGDMLPNATRDQRIASGFHRNVMTNDEGGADPDEYLAKYMVDRVSTTAIVWLGTTMGCAECHDHKYDRISQKEFYKFYAFFHNVPEKGLDGTRTENPLPRMQVPTPAQETRMRQITNTALPAAEQLVKTREAEINIAQEKWEKEIATKTNSLAEPAGLLAKFTFDDTLAFTTAAGTNVAKFSSTNPPPYGTGKIGRSFKFDGKGEFLDAGQAVALEATNAFSFGAWAKFDPKGGAILSKMEDGPGFRGFDLLVEEGKLAVHLINTWPDNGLKVQTKDAFSKDFWHHIMVVYDGSKKAAGLKIYVDGKSAPLETKTDKLSANIITNTVPLILGKRYKSLPLTGRIDDVRFYSRALAEKEITVLAQEPDLTVARLVADKRTEAQKTELKHFFRENYAADLSKAEQELAALKQKRDALNKEIPNTMVMEEMPKPRDTFILVRGNFQNKGEKVAAGVPSFLPPLPEGAPTNRLGLAEWLVSTNHPLTSRVTVNRFWQTFFGTGIVKTMNDFGSQGEWPSHPELLDWLATEFMARHWDMKSIIKTIVMSSTYRQSSTATPQGLERDRYNRLLARGPRSRLDAEFIRDNALAVSGLLNPKIGGLSVRPYQPPGIWDGTDAKFEQSHGEDLYRRGIYVYWKRSAHYPSFATFDAPNREICTAQRPRSSTPLQSLVLMNDPVYVEAARSMAARILREGGSDLKQQLTYAFRLALARSPSEQELAILERTYKEQLDNYDQDAKAADELLKVGESPLPPNAKKPLLAAWTGVANVLLNLNETNTK